MPGIVGGNNIASSAQINAGVIIGSDLANDTITTTQIGSGGVGTDEIADGVIQNSDISVSAGIVDTKLATISTAGKVSGAALTLLGSIPAGAGTIPAANLPGGGGTAGTSSGPASSSTQTITHNLGKVPSTIRIQGIGVFTSGASAGYPSISNGIYNASGNSCVRIAGVSGASSSSQNPVETNAYAIYLDHPGASSSATGVIQNVTATTFDIVWTVVTGTLASAKFIWEAN